MSRLLTTREAETGIYLDFEGRTDQPPSCSAIWRPILATKPA